MADFGSEALDGPFVLSPGLATRYPLLSRLFAELAAVTEPALAAERAAMDASIEASGRARARYMEGALLLAEAGRVVREGEAAGGGGAPPHALRTAFVAELAPLPHVVAGLAGGEEAALGLEPAGAEGGDGADEFGGAPAPPRVGDDGDTWLGHAVEARLYGMAGFIGEFAVHAAAAARGGGGGAVRPPGPPLAPAERTRALGAAVADLRDGRAALRRELAGERARARAAEAALRAAQGALLKEYGEIVGRFMVRAALADVPRRRMCVG